MDRLHGLELFDYYFKSQLGEVDKYIRFKQKNPAAHQNIIDVPALTHAQNVFAKLEHNLLTGEFGQKSIWSHYPTGEKQKDALPCVISFELPLILFRIGESDVTAVVPYCAIPDAHLKIYI